MLGFLLSPRGPRLSTRDKMSAPTAPRAAATLRPIPTTKRTATSTAAAVFASFLAILCSSVGTISTMRATTQTQKIFTIFVAATAAAATAAAEQEQKVATSEDKATSTGGAEEDVEISGSEEKTGELPVEVDESNKDIDADQHLLPFSSGTKTLAEIKKMLNEDPKLATKPSPHGETPLHVSAIHDETKLELVQLLVKEYHADPNQPTIGEYKRTPLHWWLFSASADRDKILQFLIEEGGADPFLFTENSAKNEDAFLLVLQNNFGLIGSEGGPNSGRELALTMLDWWAKWKKNEISSASNKNNGAGSGTTSTGAGGAAASTTREGGVEMMNKKNQSEQQVAGDAASALLALEQSTEELIEKLLEKVESKKKQILSHTTKRSADDL
ncbi:unnamed protein product [Amoebophrya sp. A120]|nr:unnamed protein product [Amoebophrya sp. A120]|eukprot:GSA120T00019554001.1